MDGRAAGASRLNQVGNQLMRVLAFAIVLALAGCKLGPSSPKLSAIALPEQFSRPNPISTAYAKDPGGQWWRSFRDPALDALVSAAAAGNLDIAQAVARIAAADAGITVAGAGGFPTLTLGASHSATRETGTLKKVGGNVHTSALGITSGWLIDFFGEVRSQTDAARGQFLAASAARDVAELAAISAVANTYIDARYFQERARIVASSLHSRKRTLALTMALKSEGVASGLDVSRADESVQQVAAELPLQEANIIKSLNRISTLIGQPAASLLPSMQAKIAQPLPVFTAGSGVPADLMRNRPDIRRAEHEFAASMADIGYAWSQLFPSITLSGSITPSYISSGPKSGNLTTWSFGPTLRLPIFDGGRLRANVSVAVGRAEEKHAAWRASVLSAVEEVENALTTYSQERVALEAIQRRVAASEKAAALSRTGYEAGVLSLLELLESQRAIYESQLSLAQSRRSLAQQYVALNIAVGRGLRGPGSGEGAATMAVVQSEGAKRRP
ncbi:TolC Outer membrane protein [Rhabdaerophilaceae bacterium]